MRCNLDEEYPEPRILKENARALVWYLHTGEMPTKRLYSLDPEDLRWERIRTEPLHGNACLTKSEAGWSIHCPAWEPDGEVYPNRTIAQRAYERKLKDLLYPIKLKPRLKVQRKVTFKFTRPPLHFNLSGVAEALRSDQPYFQFTKRLPHERWETDWDSILERIEVQDDAEDTHSLEWDECGDDPGPDGDI